MARPPQPADLRLINKVAKLYYEQNLTQQVIAERLLLSRPKVSRLLQQATEEGIVQITILSPPGIHAELEQALEGRFGLQEAVVVDVDPAAPANAVTRAVGTAAAEYLQRTVQDDDVIGVSWGTTLGAMVNSLQPVEVQNVHVVQMIGGLGPPESEMHATDLCRRIARALNSRLTLLPAPGIMDSLSIRQVLEADRHVQAAFELFPRMNVAYVGVGVPSPESILLRDGSIINADELAQVLKDGAVGDIALRFFNEDGQPVHSDLDERVVGITLDQLRQVKRVIGVVGGLHKLTVMCSALRGHLVNVLIVDSVLAGRLLDCPDP